MAASDDQPVEMAAETYLTDYEGLVCADCATHPPERLTPVSKAELCDVYGYDSAHCEECAVVLYDGLTETAA